MRTATPSVRNPRAALLGGAVACLCLCTAHAAETKLYKWVDANGVTHWSDRPAPGAKTVEVQAAQGYTAPPASAYPSRPSSPPADANAAAAGYSRVEVTQPAQDEAFANVTSVAVGGTASPELQPGHTAWLVVDGRRVANSMSASVPAERGSHTVVLQIVDESTGQTVASSAPVTYHVQQRSIQTPPRGPALQPPKKKP